MSQNQDTLHERSRSALTSVAVEGADEAPDALEANRHKKVFIDQLVMMMKDPHQPFFTIFFVAAFIKGITHQWVMGVPPLK